METVLRKNYGKGAFSNERCRETWSSCVQGRPFLRWRISVNVPLSLQRFDLDEGGKGKYKSRPKFTSSDTVGEALGTERAVTQILKASKG